MHSLIAEDEFVSRNLLARVLTGLGACDVAANGSEAVEAYRIALAAGTPYGLVCLDIEMPGMDGQQALLAIRSLEEAHGVSLAERSVVLMTTASEERKTIFSAFRAQCDGYLIKPITLKKITEILRVTERARPAHTE